MYFLIGRWGHGDAAGAALTFFVYTLAGSLAILLAILGLVLVVEPLTFDMRDLIAAQPLAGMDLRGGLVLLGFVLGFAVKTPLRSEEHTSELKSLMRISYAVFCLKKKNNKQLHTNYHS